jgi:hypothetical protein
VGQYPLPLAGGQASFSTALIALATQTHVPTGALARVSSYSQLGALVLVPASFGVTGAVADQIGTAATLWFGCGFRGGEHRFDSGTAGDPRAAARSGSRARACPS